MAYFTLFPGFCKQEAELGDNDNFANAWDMAFEANPDFPLITWFNFDLAPLLGKTTEVDEPNVVGGNATVWFTFETTTLPSPVLSLFGIDAVDSMFDPVGGIVFNLYTGTEIDGLSLVDTRNSDTPGETEVMLLESQRYYIQAVADTDAIDVNVTAYINVWTEPDNDDFANSEALTSTVQRSALFSTIEGSEPNVVGGDGSIWFTVNHGTPGGASITVTEFNAESFTANLYTGAALGSLSLVDTASDGDPIIWTLVASTDYHLQLVIDPDFDPAIPGFTVEPTLP